MPRKKNENTIFAIGSADNFLNSADDDHAERVRTKYTLIDRICIGIGRFVLGDTSLQNLSLGPQQRLHFEFARINSSLRKAIDPSRRGTSTENPGNSTVRSRSQSPGVESDLQDAVGIGQRS